jgi:2-haloacid dehalogenase
MKNIKAIIFDAYGTLFDVNSAAEKSKEKIGDKWEDFANYWRTTQLEYTWLRSLMKRHKDFWQVTEDSLDKSMQTYKIDLSMRNELLDLYKILSPFSEVPEVLKSLKEKKYKLAILSNGTPTLLNRLVKSNNLENIFDDIFSIEEVGIYKPDTKVYDMPINKYQIKKSEIAFLSANTWDVSGGGNYGYNSIWVNRNNNIFDNLDYQPKLEIKNLKDLLPNIKSNYN